MFVPGSTSCATARDRLGPVERLRRAHVVATLHPLRRRLPHHRHSHDPSSPGRAAATESNAEAAEAVEDDGHTWPRAEQEEALNGLVR